MTEWFQEVLPYEAKERGDGKWNVWKATPLKIDGETELKWIVEAVFDDQEQANKYISGKKKIGFI